MAIQPGEDWGTPVDSAPTDAVVASTDRDIAAALANGHQVVVRGGTLHSSLGGPSGEHISRSLAIDLLEVRKSDSDERLGVAVSSVLVGRKGRLGLLKGRILLVSNCGEFKGVSACPRAHPNDGRLDVIEVDQAMSLRQRRQAWNRATSGSHLPHPAMKVWSGESVDVVLKRNEHVVVDGVDLAAEGALTISVVVDAGLIFI